MLLGKRWRRRRRGWGRTKPASASFKFPGVERKFQRHKRVPNRTRCVLTLKLNLRESRTAGGKHRRQSAVMYLYGRNTRGNAGRNDRCELVLHDRPKILLKTYGSFFVYRPAPYISVAILSEQADTSRAYAWSSVFRVGGDDMAPADCWAMNWGRGADP